MNLREYEQVGRELYQRLSAVVRELLERAISSEQGYRLQQIQHRAKSVQSLAQRLKEKGQSDTDNIESHRKDLAGCRVVFYTNNDVRRFIGSGILREQFDIDWDRSKIHQPSPEEKEASKLFQSYNYIVKLKENRTDLVEYHEFEGLYCEVQVQTSLHHAWAEMAHDIIYKQPALHGFGSKALDDIEKRLEDVMRKHLLPAGYLFQRIASDVQRLTEGKELFDTGILDEVLLAKNNNDRHEMLSRLKDDVLPYYDDLPDFYPEIRKKLAEAWILSETTETVPYETPFGSYEGIEPHQVTAHIADIIERYRYLDPADTYTFICSLYRQMDSTQSKDQLIRIGKSLSSHTMDMWKRHGPIVQVSLAEILSKEEDIASIGPLAITIASEILKPDIEGTTVGSSAVTLHRGAIVHSKALERARRIAVDIVATYAEDMITEAEMFDGAIETLFSVGRRPHYGEVSPEMETMILSDLAHAVERITEFVNKASIDARQNIEAGLLQYWRWNKRLMKHLTAIGDVIEAYERLIRNMETLRDTLNADEDFVAFKTIVGYKSVFPHMWEEDGLDFKRDEAVRHQRQDELADTITADNWLLWKSRLATAANVKSNDLATFPPYERFLSLLADRHPDLAFDLLTDRRVMPAWTIPPISESLLGGDLRRDVEALLGRWLEGGEFVREIAALVVFSHHMDDTFIRKTRKRAVDDRNKDACLFLLQGSIRNFADDPILWKDEVFFPCLEVSACAGVYGWIDCIGYQPEPDLFFSSLTEAQSNTVLRAMVGVPRIDYAAERILSAIGSRHHKIVLDWFGQRIESASEESSANFDALPFSFQSVHEVLQPYSQDILASMRQWFDRDNSNVSWDISYFLSKIYPHFQEPLPSTLFAMIESANTNDLKFISSSLQGFQGREDLLPLLREILASDTVTDDIEDYISRVFHETGVMMGEFGAVKAYQNKADLLRPWLEDNNERVSTFADRELHSLELRVASESRRAQEEIAMRKLQYGEALDDGEAEDGEDSNDHNGADDQDDAEPGPDVRHLRKDQKADDGDEN